MNRRYELVYVASPEATDDQLAELHGQIDAIVQRMGGTLEKTEHWGRRKLAYVIGHHKEGNYVLDVIIGSGELLKEIDRRLKVIDLVIRHLVVRVDEHERVVEHTRTRRTETSRRRRLARGLPPERQPGEGQRSEFDDDRDESEQDGRFDREDAR
ncbi:MAG: 30S ribosomal protein S6 [Acidobacteria bacterium RIFCSPLOWO2_02_FULL_67_21]|nr:MAG: 30S ribosomal protein S6 [Acidobacteria bacterium RIFCSPLOWO2_02_FULL_67_21]